jgi:hypothetical protein
MDADSQATPQNDAPIWVQEVIQQMQRVVEHQDSQLQQQGTRIKDLEQLLQQQDRTAGLAAPTDSNGPVLTPATEGGQTPDLQPPREPGVVRREQLPKAPEFFGVRSEFRSWLTQMDAKLSTDKAHEPESVRFWYMHSRLRGVAANQVEPWVSAIRQTNQYSVNGLVEQLRLAYDDPQAAERASRKLSVMRQGNKSFAVFLAEFDRTILEAGGMSWSDQVRRTFLNNCLSSELKTALVPIVTPSSYRDYCSLLHTVSNNLEALRWDKKRRTNPQAMTPQTRESEVVTAVDAMDWAPSVQVTAARTKRAQWVGKDVLERRREEGRCFRCGDTEHVISKCDLLPAQKPRNDRTKQLGIALTSTNLTEDSSELEDLGKE